MQKSIAKTLQLLVVVFMTMPAFSQNILKGKVIDSSENKKLQNSIVALIDLSDTTLYRSWRAGADGSFSISKIPAGKYTLLIAYPRMADFLQELTITDTSKIDLGNISMITEAKLMQEVVVTAGRAMRMRGDTLEYTADSFAVKPGANVQALLKRLPGIEVSRNGTVTAQGQEVKKLLVDGDEFFTDDPKFAAQYLRANAVDKVQVFDKKSDEALLTGFDDGQKTKTINLKLKNSAKNGYFGKASVGANGDGNYQHELMGAAFKGPLKAGVFGIAAKSQSRDFSGDVLSKAGGEGVDFVEDGAGMMVANKSSGDNIGSYGGSGLPSILNGGAHFSNKWNNNKNLLAGNYRLRSHTGEGWNNSTSFNRYNDTSTLLRKDDNVDKSEGYGQNLSGSLAMSLDTFTKMNVKMSGSMGRKDIQRNRNSSSQNIRDLLINRSASEENENSEDKSFKSSVNIFRDMPKLSSNLSVTFEQEYGNTRSDNRLLTKNEFFDAYTGAEDSVQNLDRLQASTDKYIGYGGKLDFTSKINKFWSGQVEYGIKSRSSESRFNTLNNNGGKYDQRVDSLSNNYDFTALTQIAGGGIDYRTKKVGLGIGAKAYITGLKQDNKDIDDKRSRTFTNFAPYLRASYSFSMFTSVNLNYSGNTLQPSLEQLQPLRRTSDNINTQEGNPDLKPGFNNNISLTLNRFNLKKEMMIMLSAGGSMSSNQIINSQSIDNAGRISNKYVNVDGLPNFNFAANVSKGWRSKGIHTGFGLNYSRSSNYQIINSEKFKTSNNNYSFNTDFRYELKEIFSAGYRARVNYSDGSSEMKNAVNSKNFTHNHSVEAAVTLPWKIEVESDMNASFNPGSGSFSNSVNIVTWNAGIQKKFLESEGLILKATVNDILNKNTGYRRTIDGANWSESNGFVLRRYFMFTLTWNFLGSF